MKHRRSKVIVELPLNLILDLMDVGEDSVWKIINNWDETGATFKSHQGAIPLAPLFDGTSANIGSWGLSVYMFTLPLPLCIVSECVAGFVRMILVKT